MKFDSMDDGREKLDDLTQGIGMPQFVVADWMPDDQILLINPGVKLMATHAPTGKVAEGWIKKPSGVLLKNVGKP